MKHAVALLLGLVGPVLDVIFTPRLKRSIHPLRRVISYAITIVLSIAASAIAVASYPQSILASPFGATGPIGFLAATAVCLLLIWKLLPGVVKVLRRPELREKTDAKFAALDFMLPRTHLERAMFFPLCLSAGVCEEVLFRSFLVRYFMADPWGWSLGLAFLASCVIFGLNHFYQGWKGVLSTGIVAMLFTVVVAGFGTLIPAMILHALVDLRVLVFLLPESQRLGNPAGQAAVSSEQ